MRLGRRRARKGEEDTCNVDTDLKSMTRSRGKRDFSHDEDSKHVWKNECNECCNKKTVCLIKVKNECQVNICKDIDMQ
jgi:hypothetical protein